MSDNEHRGFDEDQPEERGGAAPASRTAPEDLPVGASAAEQAATPRVLRRARDDKVLGGVCAGLGRYLAIEPVIVRLIFIALAFAGAFGVLVYLVAWVVIPEARPGDEVAAAPGGDKHTAVILGAALVLVGTVLLLDRLVPGMDRYLWPLALIGIGVAVLVAGGRR